MTLKGTSKRSSTIKRSSTSNRSSTSKSIEEEAIQKLKELIKLGELIKKKSCPIKFVGGAEGDSLKTLIAKLKQMLNNKVSPCESTSTQEDLESKPLNKALVELLKSDVGLFILSHLNSNDIHNIQTILSEDYKQKDSMQQFCLFLNDIKKSELEHYNTFTKEKNVNKIFRETEISIKNGTADPFKFKINIYRGIPSIKYYLTDQKFVSIDNTIIDKGIKDKMEKTDLETYIGNMWNYFKNCIVSEEKDLNIEIKSVYNYEKLDVLSLVYHKITTTDNDNELKDIIRKYLLKTEEQIRIEKRAEKMLLDAKSFIENQKNFDNTQRQNEQNLKQLGIGSEILYTPIENLNKPQTQSQNQSKAKNQKTQTQTLQMDLINPIIINQMIQKFGNYYASEIIKLILSNMFIKTDHIYKNSKTVVKPNKPTITDANQFAKNILKDAGDRAEEMKKDKKHNRFSCKIEYRRDAKTDFVRPILVFTEKNKLEGGKPQSFGGIAQKPRKKTFDAMTVKELRVLAIHRNIKGYSTMRKDDLIAVLRKTRNKNKYKLFKEDH